jgi:hypothetical protein
MALDSTSKVYGWGKSDNGAIGVRAQDNSYP